MKTIMIYPDSISVFLKDTSIVDKKYQKKIKTQFLDLYIERIKLLIAEGYEIIPEKIDGIYKENAVTKEMVFTGDSAQTIYCISKKSKNKIYFVFEKSAQCTWKLKYITRELNPNIQNYPIEE